MRTRPPRRAGSGASGGAPHAATARARSGALVRSAAFVDLAVFEGVAQLPLETPGDATQLAHHPPGGAPRFGQLVGAEDDERQSEDREQLTGPEVEHRAVWTYAVGRSPAPHGVVCIVTRFVRRRPATGCVVGPMAPEIGRDPTTEISCRAGGGCRSCR